MKAVHASTTFTIALIYLLAGSLISRGTSPAPSAEVSVGYTCGDLKADPSRNLVYLVDQTDNLILEIDTTVGLVVKTVAIEDGSTLGKLAVSVDNSTLYLAESTEDKILTFSLPGLTTGPSIPVGFSPMMIATGVNGRLYASVYSSTAGLIREINTSTGAIVQTFGTSEDYYDAPLLRTNAAGTNLYAAETGISGFTNIYEYNIAGTTASAATPYRYDEDNLADFSPDETNSRIYLANGVDSGIRVLNTTDDDYSTVWPLSGSYPVAISYSPSGTVVYGACSDPYSGDIKTFSRSDGSPIADNTVTTNAGAPVIEDGVAATPNGNAVYVRQGGGATYVGIIGLSHLSPVPDPLGGAYLSQGFFYNATFGYYNEIYYPWIYHSSLGWIYVDVPNAAAAPRYLYVESGNSNSMGWLYVTNAQFPEAYSFSKSSWLFYDVGGTSFYNYSTQAWETY